MWVVSGILTNILFSESISKWGDEDDEYTKESKRLGRIKRFNEVNWSTEHYNGAHMMYALQQVITN